MTIQRTGQVTLKLNGSQLRSMPGATLQIGGIQRDAEATDQGDIVFGEKTVPATASCEMPHVSDTDLEALRDFKGGTLVFECQGTGVSYVLGQAFTTSIGDLSNGKVAVNFAGMPAKSA